MTDNLPEINEFNDIPNEERYQKNSLDPSRIIKLNNITGVIDNDDLGFFKKTIFRITKGNAYVNYSQLPPINKGKNG